MRFKHGNHSVFIKSVIFAVLVSCIPAASAFAQAQPANGKRAPASQTDLQKTPPAASKTDTLQQLSASLEALVARVSPAVVEIQVASFGPVEKSGDGRAAVVGRQDVLGSGVIIDPEGYIVTNAHVVANARSIEVLMAPSGKALENGQVEKTRYAGHLVGVHKDTDLALIKIDAKALPFLPLDSKRRMHQGEIVLALGNPEGLGNSVSMGVISAVDRQPDPKLPMVYIQTDAPINPGNSGGPLIDIDGYVLGINTFILSEGGGSEGLGFAIPARVVSFVVDRLRKFGHVDRSEIGAEALAITPLLAKGLQLPVSSGVIIVDVKPGGPAESAGVKIGDLVMMIDGKPIRSLPQLAASLYLHATDEVMKVNVLRGTERLAFDVPVLPHRHDVDQLQSRIDPQKNAIPQIGVLAVDVDDNILAMLPLRIRSGAVVVANTASGRRGDIGLRPGDVVHAVNGKPVTSLAELQKAISGFESSAAVVLQVERADGMDFVAFEIE